MLTPEELDHVRPMLASRAWAIVRARLENRAHTAAKALALTPGAERTKVFAGQDFDTTDDVLRAIIRDCEWMMFSWVNEIAVANHNQRRDELDRQVLQ
jgi:hypothetical protein